MKKITMVFLLSFAALSLMAGDDHKSCDMKAHDGKTVSVTGKVACKATDDCSFKTADDQTFTLCEMSKADLPSLSESGATVTVTGKLITCDGKEKLRIEKVASK